MTKYDDECHCGCGLPYGSAKDGQNRILRAINYGLWASKEFFLEILAIPAILIIWLFWLVFMADKEKAKEVLHWLLLVVAMGCITFLAVWHFKPSAPAPRFEVKAIKETEVEQINRLVPLESLNRVQEIEQRIKAQDIAKRR